MQRKITFSQHCMSTCGLSIKICNVNVASGFVCVWTTFLTSHKNHKCVDDGVRN